MIELKISLKPLIVLNVVKTIEVAQKSDELKIILSARRI